MERWHFYVREAHKQLEFARSSFSSFEQAMCDGDNYLAFASVHHFLVHIANVDKLLNPKAGSTRAAALNGRIDWTGVDLKSFRRLRNHLEHFDERLDSWVENHEGQTFFDMNIVTGAVGFPKQAFLRAIDGKTFKFYGEDYPLDPLREAVDILHRRLGALLP